MTTELGLMLGLAVTIVGVMVWLVRLGKKSEAAEHTKREIGELEEAAERGGKWRVGGGLAGAWRRRRDRLSDDSSD